MARTSTTKLSARERARAAKAKLDADERDHQKLVEDGVIAYYEAEDALESAADAATAAEVARAAAVNTLVELNESVSRIASLTGLDASEVRKLKRAAATPNDRSDDNAATVGSATEVQATTAKPSTSPTSLAS